MFHAVDKALTGVRKSITEAEKKMEKKIKQVGNDMVETEHKVEKTIKKEGLIGATVHGIGNALEDMLFFTIDELICTYLSDVTINKVDTLGFK